jgi:hypothetical protein
MPITAYLQVSDPPRGGGTQPAQTLQIETLTFQRSWGAKPANASLTYVAPDIRSQIAVGSFTRLSLLGQTFYGVCLSDRLDEASGGKTRRFEYADLRYFLDSDCVFGQFNQLDTRQSGGRRVKRYRHLLPANYFLNRYTYTSSPYTAAQILDFLFNAPTVVNVWAAVYHTDQVSWPVFDLDFNGVTLGTALQQVSDKQGLLFKLESTDLQPYRLMWGRKGEGALPLPVDGNGYLVFPEQTDEWRTGLALSGNPTRVRVLGDRNRYQVLNVLMEPDWNRAWEDYWDFSFVIKWVYKNLSTHVEWDGIPANTRYNAIPSDPEHIIGWQLAAARAKEMTVRQWDFLNGAADFTDARLFASRSRNDMPVKLYIESILFRAFRPPSTITLPRRSEQARHLRLINEQIAAVTINPIANLPMKWDLTLPIDGNGLAVAKGFQVSEEVFRVAQPDRFRAKEWQGGQNIWAPVSFTIDQSGEDGGFILFDMPIINSSDLVTQKDGHYVVKSAPTFTIPAVRASLTFEAERYYYIKTSSAAITGHIDAVANVGGLNLDTLVNVGSSLELSYDDGLTADTKADRVADTLLQRQFSYVDGGYTVRLTPASVLPVLSTVHDRITIRIGPDGHDAVIDFTNERKGFWEPERDFDRRTAQRAVFAGQLELMHEARQARFLASALRDSKKLYASLSETLGGQDHVVVKDGDGADLAAGTPLFKKPTVTPVDNNTLPTQTEVTKPSATTTAEEVFAGVVVRDEEPDDGRVPVQTTGMALARVEGPVSVGDALGFSTGNTHLVVDGIPAVGVAKQEIATTEVKLIRVMLGEGGSSGAAVWLP